eukprot:CAMPEP_0198196722 /NCGR_PEP_ID=MMETSP1445-20131203/77_1 /TAXON_ID=36898 /ORGANISM="Pyramimonas sp., Strain CCMP2087" /LENGTH=399 /DNA_ID=CAMNT_0043865655 /DNA_START=543 /DNA_END=1742 /DNA_ORIENTATION=+
MLGPLPPIGPQVDDSIVVIDDARSPANQPREPRQELPEPPAEVIIRSPEFLGTHRVGQGDLLRVGNDPVLYLSFEGETMLGAALCVRARCEGPCTASTVVWLKDALDCDLPELYSTRHPTKKLDRRPQVAPESFTVREVGPYRIRLLGVETEGGRESDRMSQPRSASQGSPTSPQTAAQTFENSPIALNPLANLSAVHVVTIAVDRPDPESSSPPRPIPPLPHLKPGESRSFWLSSKHSRYQQRSIGHDPDNVLDIGMHILPINPAPPPSGRASDEEPQLSYWRAELDLMRLSAEHEGHMSIRVDGKRLCKKGGVVVGDYRVEVKKRAVPMCKAFGLRLSKGAPRSICTEYSMLLLHVLVCVTRLTEAEAAAHLTNMLEAAFALTPIQDDSDATDVDFA